MQEMHKMASLLQMLDGGKRMTSWLVADTSSVKGGKIEYGIPERPLLHCCCNKDTFGDVRLDFDPAHEPDILADITKWPARRCSDLNFEEFAATFADFPWVKSWQGKVKPAIRNMLRLAPVAYVICPWLYGWKGLRVASVHVSWRPGINHPILFVKYVRSDIFWEVVDDE